MSNNCTVEMKKEAIKIERARLLRLTEDGRDTEEALDALDEFAKLIDSGNVAKANNVVRKHNKQFAEVDSRDISRMNLESPRTRTGAPIVIHSGIFNDGSITYQISYLNGKKKYPMDSTGISLKNNMDATESVRRASEQGKKFKDKLEDFDKISAGDLMNNPDDVKEFVDKLIDMDNVAIDKDTRKMLRSVIDIVADPIKKYGREMNVYINDKAKHNGGEILLEGKKKGIYLSRGTGDPGWGNDMSLAERYVHELVHATTYFAYNYGNARVTGTVNRLKKLQDTVMRNITVDDLLPEHSINKAAEREVAQAQWDYMNSSKNSTEEFLALAMTNKRLRDVMSTIDAGKIGPSYKGLTLLQKLNEWVTDMIAKVFEIWRKEPRGYKADQLVMKLHRELMEANSLASRGWNNKIIDKSMEKLDDIEDWWVEAVDKMQEKAGLFSDVDLSKIPGRDEPVKGVVWLMKNSWKLWGNPETKPVMQRILKNVLYGVGNPTGTLQTLLRQFSDTDSFQDKLEEMGLARETVERERRQIKQSYKKVLGKMWGRKLTADENKTITMGVLKSDMAALMDDYSEEQIQDLLTVDGAVEQAIADEMTKIDTSNIRTKRHIEAQSNGLAEFMVSGKANRLLEMNAYNILKQGPDTDSEVKLIEESYVLDRVITLKAIQKQSDDTKALLKKLANENIGAVTGYARIYADLTGKEGLAPSQRLKGFIKETFNSDASSKIASVNDEEELLEQGYILKSKIKGSKKGPLGEVALYVNDERLVDSFNTSAMGLTDSMKHTGTVVTDSMYYSDSSDVARQIKRKIALMSSHDSQARQKVMDGNDKLMEENMSLVAVRGEDGKVTTYVYVLNTAQKMKYLDMDMDPGSIVGSMAGAYHDRQMTDDLNDKLMDQLVANMKKNIEDEDIDDFTDIDGEVGIDGHTYVKVVENSNIPEVADIWRSMPGTMKKRIRSMGNKGLWVREDALNDAFGVRDISIVNMVGIKLLPKVVKHHMRMLEKLLKSVISIFKVDIIMRTPAVLIGNIVSNTMYLIQMGFNVKDVFTMQATGYAELNRYIKNSHRISELEAKSVAKGLSKAQLEELRRLKSTLTSGAIGDLIDAGLYQSIVEDVGMADIDSSNKIHNWANGKLEDWNAPGWVKTGANYAYMSEKTSPFQLMQRATAYSDFVARYSMYHMATEKARKKFKRKNGREMTPAELEVTKKELIKEIRNSFINYSKPDSPFLKWLNDVGLMMFTKYAIRIQKVWKDGVSKHPLRFMLAAVGQEIAGINIDDITDKSIIERAGGDLVYMPEFSESVYNAVVPVMARLDTKF